MSQPLQVKPGEEFPIPARCAQCPECGGELRAEVDEWYEGTREPTEGGLTVWCEYDSPYDSRMWTVVAHDYTGTDWIPIQAKCERWATENVRVSEGVAP